MATPGCIADYHFSSVTSCLQKIRKVTAKTNNQKVSIILNSHGSGEESGTNGSPFPLPGRPTNLDYSRARAYCACRGCEWGLFEHYFLSSIVSLLFVPLSGRRPDVD